MLISLCQGKIHRVTVTEANLHYEGSCSVDIDLIEAAGMRVYQEVSIVNVNNGARFNTYLIPGDRGSGTVCLNGAAARLGEVGDIIIIMAYGMLETDKIPDDYKPKVVMVDDKNRRI